MRTPLFGWTMILVFSVVLHCSAEEKIDDPARVDSIQSEVASRLVIGPRITPALVQRDPAKDAALRVRKLQDDIRSGKAQHGSMGSVWGEGGVSHLVACVDGYVIEREYYSNSCSVATKSSESNSNTTITTIKDENGQVLETITWQLAPTKKSATITDPTGAWIETFTFKAL